MTTPHVQPVHVTLMTGTMVATTEQTASAVPVRPLLQISVPSALCPDLLRWEQLGTADGRRGRVVRAFFWLLRAWPPRQ